MLSDSDDGTKRICGLSPIFFWKINFERYSPLDPIFFVPNCFPHCHYWYYWLLPVASGLVQHEPELDCPISMAFDLAVLNSFRMSPTCLMLLFVVQWFAISRSLGERKILTQFDETRMRKCVNGVVEKTIKFLIVSTVCHYRVGFHVRFFFVQLLKKYRICLFADTQMNTCTN